jgi:P-loop Nucleotide Kinase3
VSHALVYLAGAPAVGKSTLMAELTKNCIRFPANLPIPHEALVRGGAIIGAEMGRRRPGFPGTDTLSMSIHVRARQFLDDHQYPLVLGEGQRLGSRSFMEAALTAGYDVTLVHLTADDDVLAERRSDRVQNEKWSKGAATQAANLAASGVVRTVEADAGKTAAELALEVIMLVPALHVLS